MSYEEKGAWVYLVVVVPVYVGYVSYVLSLADGAPLDGVAYVRPLLWSLGISIVANVVARIVVEMVRPSDTYDADVRDKQISRFGDYVGGAVLGIGMILPLVLTLVEQPYFWIANAIYLVFVLSAVVGTVVKVTAYRRGLAAW